MGRLTRVSALCWLLGTSALLAGEAGRPSRGAEAACAEIEGLEKLLVPRMVLVLGEIHGTRESPAFTGEVVCGAVRSGMSVTLGLELLDTESTAVASYLDSPRHEAARERLVGSGAWSAAYQDGRTSLAMLELLDRVGSLRDGGASVEVALFDRSGWRSGRERDQLMAEALGEIVTGRDTDLVVVLTGNIHSRLTQGTPWNEAYRPMTHLLSGMIDHEILSLNVAHAGGTAWICNGSEPSSCGVRKVGGMGRSEGLAIELGGDLASTGHHGSYHVGPLTASPPVAGAP